MELNNKELTRQLLILFVICLQADTDSCDLTIGGVEGIEDVICHIEFRPVKGEE
jgi:hypothetical protein